MTRRPTPALLLLLVVGLVVAGAAAWRLARDDGGEGEGRGRLGSRPSTAEVSSEEAFAARRDHYVDAVLALERSGNFDLGAAQGLLLLDRAARTGDRSRVDEANELILRATGAIADPPDGTEANAQIAHGGPFTFLRIVLQFGDDPELLHPETLEKVKWGRSPDGSVDPAASLLAYRDELFGRYTVDGIDFDIVDFNPWEPAQFGEYNGTENHKLQTLVAGMLLSEVYAGETHRGFPVKDGTPATDDYWHYFRDAFFRFSARWGDDLADHFARDPVQLDIGSPQYLRTHLGDYWLLRDLYSDDVVRAHAEVLIDRILADWAEDLVLGVQTGYTRRYNHDDLDWGRTYHQHVLNYLVFDNLGYPLPEDHPFLYDFSGWANVSLATSDYNPTHPDFPLAVVDLARDKGDGYAVRAGSPAHFNWVERDLSLGFLLRGRLGAEAHAGAFVVHDRVEPGAGLAVIPFHGEQPIVKGRPRRDVSGVAAPRAAVLRHWSREDEARLWVQEGFDEVADDEPGWLFLAEETSAGRTAYLAVGAPTGELRRDGDVDGGATWALGGRDSVTVWQVSTSDEHATLDDFRADVLDRPLEVADATVTYTAVDGTELVLDRSGTDHVVDGEPVDWDDYDRSLNTPWTEHRHGEAVATLSRNGYVATYDWSAAADGDFDQPPAKEVLRP